MVARLAGAVCVAMLAAAGCTSLPGALGQDGPVVVTTTNVYADIVHAIAGEHARVTALIANPNQDPHDFEAGARNQLAVSKADVVVENGGGYDDFVRRMLAASGKPGVTVIDVVALSGRTAGADGELNEHVWYDLPTVALLVRRLVTVLGAEDPAARAAYRANAAAFLARLWSLEHTEATIRARFGGRAVAITEPLPVYLLRACGLMDRTPPQFSAAVEAGSEVSASVLRQTLELFTHHKVAALVYNAQTSGAETTLLEHVASTHDIPAVPVTETLPAGQDYLSWMRSNLDRLRSALAS